MMRYLSISQLIKVLRSNKVLIFGILLLFTTRSVLADWSLVPSESMQPTIQVGDYVWIDKKAYDLRVPFSAISLARLGNPERGDIIIFDSEVVGKRMVKRVAALPGDVISMPDGRVLEIPEDHFFVLGDNRLNSADSRVIGLVPRRELKGKATHVIASFNTENYLLPRSDRFLKKLL